MRDGDFSIEVVAAREGRVRELDSGHVLARPGQVYRLRLRNHGPLHCVVDVDVDGSRVTAGGLVVAPWSVTELERPVDASDDGCFTVVAEGNEAVFGPDGGRDDTQLGLIEARFRRELPGFRHAEPPPTLMPTRDAPPAPARPLPGVPPLPPRFPAAPPEWVPPLNRFDARLSRASGPSVQRALAPRTDHTAAPGADAIERAAGTGLTGHSDQRFVPFQLGPLEDEATVLRLRIVIGTDEALAGEPARPLADRQAPARPAARP